MPELPEIETIKRALEPHVVDKIIRTIEVFSPKQVVGDIQSIVGSKIISLQRKGKYLALKTSSNHYLNFHLKMSGQILFSPHIENHKYTRFLIEFNDNSVLLFNDMRKFGWLHISDKPEEPKAPDVLSPEFSAEYFFTIVKASNQPIKSLLLDQNRLAGVGNIYANDALFTAGIRPERKSGSLTDEEIKKLYAAVLQIIKEGVERKGSSASEVYRLPDSTKGSYQDFFKVYSREGKPCLRCQSAIIRIKHNGRSSFYCPHCQV